jgi:hypothetical protein
MIRRREIPPPTPSAQRKIKAANSVLSLKGMQPIAVFISHGQHPVWGSKGGLGVISIGRIVMGNIGGLGVEVGGLGVEVAPGGLGGPGGRSVGSASPQEVK